MEHYREAILLILLLTVFLGSGIAFLKTEMTFFSVLPRNSSQVQDLRKITEDFPAASQIILVVDARNIDNTEEAESLVRMTLEDLEREFSSEKWDGVVESVSTGLAGDYIRDRGMMLFKPEDQERILNIYSDPDLTGFLTHLNDDYEREYSGNEEKLEDDEDTAIAQVRGLGKIMNLLEQSTQGTLPGKEDIGKALDLYFSGDSYLFSRDNRMGLLMIRPTFTLNDFNRLKDIDILDKRAEEIAGPRGISVGLTGMIVVGKDEMATSEQGLGLSMAGAFLLILLLLIAVFRMKSVPFIAGLPLILGIIWTAGLTGFVIHRLNIVTAMYMVALIGLGIDFAIHILATYVQLRDEGRTFHDALVDAYRISGAGIITGGFTTAAAFLALSFSQTDMISELGLVAGMGILCEMTAMLMAIPPLLAIRYRRKLEKGIPDMASQRKYHVSSTLTGGLGRFVHTHPGFIIAIFMVAGLLLSTQAGKVRIEDNLMNMEARGLKSIELQDTLVEEFGMAADGLYLIVDDPERISILSDALDDLDSVKAVDSLARYLPDGKEYYERLPLTEQFSRLLQNLPEPEAVDPDVLTEELFRLEMNLIELGDLAYLGQMGRLNEELNNLTGLNRDGIKTQDSVFDRLADQLDGADPASLQSFQSLLRPLLVEYLADMADTREISQMDLPSVARDTYISRDGMSFLTFINPRQNPWEGEFRSIFTKQVASVTDRATGMILASDQMNHMARTDGIFAAALAVIVVFLLLLWDFRNLKLVLLTFLPLILSFTTLFGIMALANIKFDFVNIIAIPLLIGIGIDDAVHINHRYLKEGKGSMDRVIGATGTAVFLTTLTTIIGFGSFIPSIMRAMRSTGVVLVIAMSLAFLYSVVLHPAILIFVRETLGGRIENRRDITKQGDENEK